MDTSTRTIELVIDPRGHDKFLKDGREPGLQKYYHAPAGSPPEHGRGYTQYFWASDDSAWIAWPEVERIRKLAKGKRKPFAVTAQIVPPVPGLDWHGRSVSTDWARDLCDAEDAETLRQAAARQ
jgi:hypothetical protein